MAHTPDPDAQPQSVQRYGPLRRIIQVGLVLAAILVVLIVVLLQRFPAESFRPWIEEILTKRLGRPVSIEKLYLAPLRGLELTNARVLNSEGTEDLLIESLEFEFDLYSLFRGEIQVQGLHAAGIDVLLRQSADGQWNWQGNGGSTEDAGKRSPSARASGPLDLPVEFESVMVERLRVRLQTPKIQASAGNFSLNAHGRAGPRHALRVELRAEDGARFHLKTLRGPQSSTLELALAGELVTELHDGEQATLTTSWSLDPNEMVIAGQALSFDLPIRFEAKCTGRISNRGASCDQLDISAAHALKLSSSGRVSISDSPESVWNIARLKLDLGTLALIASEFNERRLEVEGELVLDELVLGYSENAVKLAGHLRGRTEAARYDELALSQLTIDATFAEILFDKQMLPVRGDGGIRIGWGGLSYGRLARLRDGSFNLSTAAMNGQIDWEARTEAIFRVDTQGVAHDGPVSAELAGSVRVGTGELTVSQLVARARGIALSGDASVQLPGTKGAQWGHQLLRAQLKLKLADLISGWFHEAGNPTALENAGLEGAVRLELVAERAGPDNPVALAAEYDGHIRTENQDIGTIEDGRVSGSASTLLESATSSPATDATLMLRAKSIASSGYLAKEPRFELQVRTDPAESDLLVSKVRLTIAALLDQHAEDAGPLEQQPLSLGGTVRLKLTDTMETRLVLALDWGGGLHADLNGTILPSQRHLRFRAHTPERWRLQSLIARFPLKVRKLFRDGALAGEVGFDVQVEGVIPKHLQRDRPIPLRISAQSEWAGVSGELIEQGIGLSESWGSIKCENRMPQPSSHPLICSGKLQLRDAVVAGLKHPQLGPTVASFEGSIRTLSHYELRQFKLYNDRAHTGLSVTGEYLPSARPAQLTLNLETLTHAPEMMESPLGGAMRGTLGLAARIQRAGSGPFVLRGELDLENAELQPHEKIYVGKVSGQIPLGLSISLGGSRPRISELRRSAEARGGGILPELLSERLSYLAGSGASNPLTIERVDAPRVAVRQLAAQASIVGNRLLLDELEANMLDGSLTGRIEAKYDDKLRVLFALAARRLDFRKVIPPERLPADARGDPRPYWVNADFNTTLSYPPAAIDGEVQITRLGREVLFASLDLIDPKRENTSVINLRRQLEDYAVLRPRSASLKVEHGSGDVLVILQRAKVDWWNLKSWATFENPKDIALHLGHFFYTGNQMAFPISGIPLDAILGRVTKR